MNVRDSHAAREYLNAPIPARSTPWRELDFTVVDLETTGLNPSRDEIVSFATVTVSHGKVSLADARYELVRPRRMPGEDTSRIHGLREADLIEAPSLEDPGRPRRRDRARVSGGRARRVRLAVAKPVR
jgi:DNA polymerase III epsilon subunit-like protein